MEAKVEHRPERNCFEATLDGAQGRIEYELHPGTMAIVHTEVDPVLEGRGVAGALVRAALGHARAQGLKVDPVCDYTRSYMERHPDTLSLRV